MIQNSFQPQHALRNIDEKNIDNHFEGENKETLKENSKKNRNATVMYLQHVSGNDQLCNFSIKATFYQIHIIFFNLKHYNMNVSSCNNKVQLEQ